MFLTAIQEQLQQPKGLMGWLEQPHVKWAVPIPLLLGLAPLVWLFFRKTWRELDEEALLYRQELLKKSQVDYRPIVALVLTAVVLTLQEYYGGRAFFDVAVRKWLEAKQAAKPHGLIRLDRYEQLYSLAWWTITRGAGYLLPFLVWPVLFRKDSLRDFGLRTKGFLEHAWIYGMFIAIMIPVMQLVAKQPDFGTYYPFYKVAKRSWFDFLVWEAMYVFQFFTLELFFRGWWVRATRAFGSGAIFSMVLPYTMIHFGKPYLEACGAIVAGTVLGSLSMKTKSIYAGFLVHVTVAILMDFFALDRRGDLPTLLHMDSQKTFVFRHVRVVFWLVWVIAILLLVIKIVRSYPAWKAWYLARKSRAMS